VICNGGRFQVSGVLQLKQVFVLTVFDHDAKQHTIYFVPPQILAISVYYGTIFLDGALPASMKDMLNYDPAQNHKKPRVISTMTFRDAVERPELLGLEKLNPGDDIAGRLLLLYYDPSESKVCTICHAIEKMIY